jgi:ribosomal protein S18 acetylase RimI-like enzyme
VAPTEVCLVDIVPETARRYLDLETHRSQRRFVATMPDSFADVLFPEVIDGAPVVPSMWGIEADGVAAGFVMIAAVTDHHPEPYLWRLLIDRRFQRRGIGGRALDRLIALLVQQGCTRLFTSWVEGAGGPEPFYRARGFQTTGRIVDDEIEAVLDPLR